MTALPTVGGDSGAWGTILNNYLSVAHNPSGTLANHFYNVKDYGATGNGSSDDTVGIQAAIDAAAVLGGTVLFPSGTYISQTLSLKSKVFLQGVGRSRGTLLKLKNATNAPLVQLYDVNVEMAGITNMFLHGNQANQTVGADLIYINQTAGSGFEFNDAMLLFENLIIAYSKGFGLYVTGISRSISIINVEVHNSTGGGIYIAATDGRLESCIAAYCGTQGFYITGNNNHLCNCKAFYCGQTTAASGDGFYITASFTDLANCEAQDNKANGFNFYGASRPVNVGFVADSNGTGVTGSGLVLDNSSSGMHTGLSFDRQGTPAQAYGVSVLNGSGYNIIQANCRTNASGSFSGVVGTNQLLIAANAASWIDRQSHYELTLSGLGIVTEVYPRVLHASTSIMIDGTVYAMAVGLREGDVITNLVTSVSTIGATVTASKYGIYSKAGTILAATADLGTLLQGTGQKSAALSSPYTVPLTDLYYFAVFAKASTLPTLHRSSTNGNAAGAFNGNILFGSVTGQTNLSNITLAVGGSPICYWMCAT